MTLSLTNGLLAILSVLASGYVIYTSPICRLWLPKADGYVLYFSTVVTGLALFYLCYALIYILSRCDFLPLDLTLAPENAPFLAFPFALFLWVLATAVFWFYGKHNPKGKRNLILKSLNEKGLDYFIFKRLIDEGMIMVTLENNKVYTGWPIDASNNEDNQWLRLVPQWSGYRDKKSTITVQTDYSKVFNISPSNQNRMLIPVEKIVTVQPFAPEIFQKFNSKT